MGDNGNDGKATEEKDAQEEPKQDAGSDDAHASGMGEENNRPDDTLADEKKCPECGEPVDDVRATCINCGYEYKDEDHEDPDAGSEFVTGSQIDDEGNELPDEEPPPDSEASGDDDGEGDSDGGDGDDGSVAKKDES